VTQYPSEWKDFLCTGDTLTVLAAQHAALPMPFCRELLRAICGIIGTRRSFLDQLPFRTQWIDYGMQTLVAISSLSDDRLQHEEYRHVVAECIARFIPPHAYRDLLSASKCSEFFQFAADFSRRIFGIPFGQGGSFATTSALMQFWARVIQSKKLVLQGGSLTMSSATPTAPEEPPPLDIELYIPTLVREFCKVRLLVADYDLDEDAVDSLMSQAEALAPLVALQPVKCLEGITVDCAEHASTIASHGSTLLWLVYISGGVVKLWLGQLREESVAAASSFIGFAIKVLLAHQAGPGSGRDSTVEAGVVYLLSALQSCFAGVRLSSLLATVAQNVFGEKEQLFQFVLSSVGSNMLSTSLNSRVVQSSIDLIIETCREMPNSQLQKIQGAFNLPPIVELPIARSEVSYKLRTSLMKALYTVKLPDPFQPEHFVSFMQPIHDQMLETLNGTPRGTEPLFIGGWLRDLRGIAAATAMSSAAFGEFLDWVMERRNAIATVAAMTAPPYAVTSSLMKFLLQLVTPNYPSGRVNVPHTSHSPVGVYLFQFVASTLQTALRGLLTPTLQQSLQLGQAPTDVWPRLLKHLRNAMEICRRCVQGEFCPFGAMQLYGDTLFDDVVTLVFKITRLVPERLFKEYQKLGVSSTLLLRTMNDGGAVTPFAAMSSDELLFLITHALRVVADVDEQSQVVVNALQFLSFISSLFPLVQRYESASASPGSPSHSPTRALKMAKELVAQKLVGQQSLWHSIVTACMNVITLQDRGLSPATSCLFPIFQNDPSAWELFRQQLLLQYHSSKHDKVVELLTKLCSDVSSQDKFFSNVVTFRMGIRSL